MKKRPVERYLNGQISYIFFTVTIMGIWHKVIIGTNKIEDIDIANIDNNISTNKIWSISDYKHSLKRDI